MGFLTILLKVAPSSQRIKSILNQYLQISLSVNHNKNKLSKEDLGQCQIVNLIAFQRQQHSKKIILLVIKDLQYLQMFNSI